MNEKARLKSVSDLLKSSWEQYTKHYESLVPIMLVAGIGLYLQTIVALFASHSASMGILIMLSSLIYILGMIWGFAALLNKIHKIDQPMTVGQAFTNAKPLVWPLFITGLLVFIFTLIGLIGLIVGAIVVGVYLSFALYIVVNENKSGMDAVKASKDYVTGYWWPIFGRALVIGIVIGVVAGIIGKIGQMILGYNLGLLLQGIASLALTPLAVIYQYQVYLNVKSVKSGAGSMSAPSSTPAPTPAPFTPSAPAA
ncbi:MAG TPA: hypothetical protein VHQ41_01560 [Patescibacteria group bacterium]|jgi:hypothetical protein|nr:hypothetical protein [Patescibacteria group bacterium]